MIRSFKSSRTETLFNDNKVGRLGVSEKVARRKLKMLDDAVSLDDLAVLPGNRLEALQGERQGQYRLRVNERCTILFLWDEGNAHDVESVDNR